MLNRAELKAQARIFLKKNFSIALSVVILMILLGGYKQGEFINIRIQDYETIPVEDYQERWGDREEVISLYSKFPIYRDDQLVILKKSEEGAVKYLNRVIGPPWIDAINIWFQKLIFSLNISKWLFIFSGGILLLLLRIFVRNPILYGGHRFFLSGTEGEVRFGELWTGFDAGRYTKVVYTMFSKDLSIFLWSLLLLIPGIVKSYEYCMVPYILADEPDLTKDEVMERSKKLTEGHKMEIFVLGLSFLGWHILGSIFWNLGDIFVEPYVLATEAQLYLKLKELDADIPSIEYEVSNR